MITDDDRFFSTRIQVCLGEGLTANDQSMLVSKSTERLRLLSTIGGVNFRIFIKPSRGVFREFFITLKNDVDWLAGWRLRRQSLGWFCWVGQLNDRKTSRTEASCFWSCSAPPELSAPHRDKSYHLSYLSEKLNHSRHITGSCSPACLVARLLTLVACSRRAATSNAVDYGEVHLRAAFLLH